MSKINIYGTGYSAIRYVLSHPELSINCFIDGKNTKDSFLGYKVLSPEKGLKELKEYYTLIATSENSFWEIKKELEEKYGLTEFENFEFAETYKKQIAIIYGNCHTIPVKSVLCQSPQFNAYYGFYPLKTICDIKANNGLGIENKAYERCRLFIHQAIRDDNFYGEIYSSKKTINKLNKKCKIIAMPNLYRLPRFMFPQMENYDNQVYYENYNFFPFRDKYIDMYYKQLSIIELSEIIEDESLINYKHIIEQYDLFLDKVRQREVDWDLHISEFIISNMQEQQLFFDPNHPTPFIINYIANNILKILGYTEINCTSNALDSFELPVYSSVRKALNLNWKKEFLRTSGNKLTNNLMDTKEYIKQYILWNFRNDLF